jgi:RimJ/RimL family protein N-acetyltransferase
VRLIADFAFRETDLLRLEIVCALGNVASQRVAERAGAVREGVLRHRLLLHGEPVDAVMYSLVRPTRSAANP